MITTKVVAHDVRVGGVLSIQWEERDAGRPAEFVLEGNSLWHEVGSLGLRVA